MMRLLRQTTLPLVGLALACSISGPEEPVDPLVRLDDSRRAWQQSGISQYELAMRRSCGECPPAAALAVIVSVSAGEKTVSLAVNGEPVDPSFAGLYPDVGGLFELIETALANGAEVDVNYDDDRGYPRSVSIDAVPQAVDDEFGYVIDQLVVGRLAALRAELSVQREQWAAQRIEDYQLTFSRSCFCAPEGVGLVIVNVLEGEPVEWLYFLSGDPIAPQWQAVFPTVDGLFDFIEDAIDRGAESIEVTYDAELGLPTAIRVDYRLAAADEEIAYEVEKLLPIDNGEPPSPDRSAGR